MKRIGALLLTMLFVVGLTVSVRAATIVTYAPEWNDELKIAYDRAVVARNADGFSSYGYYSVFCSGSTGSLNFIVVFTSVQGFYAGNFKCQAYVVQGNTGTSTLTIRKNWHYSVYFNDPNNWDYVQLKLYSTSSLAWNNPTLAYQYYFVENMSTHDTSSNVAFGRDQLWQNGGAWVVNTTPPPIDKTALQALINTASTMQGDGYTAASWNALQSSLAAAISVNNDSSVTQAQVNAARADLQAAISGLVKELPNTDLLESQLAACKAIPNDGYTAASWNALQSAIHSAENLLLREDYTAEEIEDVLFALIDARRGLSYPPASGGLQALIAQASAIQNTGYTPESWNALQGAIASANALLSSGSYTDAELSAAAASINSAVGGLRMESISLPDTPEGHRYLVDGVLPADLLPAQNAIFENVDWGRGAGLWAFGAMFVVYLAVRIVRTWVGIQGEARYIDMNEPGAESSFVRDGVSGRIRKKRNSDV